MTASTHPRGGGHPGMSFLALGGNLPQDMTVGYPLHRVEAWKTWTNPHGVEFTDWRASCGATGTDQPWNLKRGMYHYSLPRERCRRCWTTHHNRQPNEKAT